MIFNVKDIVKFRTSFEKEKNGIITEKLEIKKSLNESRNNKIIYLIKPFSEEKGRYLVLDEDILSAYSSYYEKQEIEQV